MPFQINAVSPPAYAEPAGQRTRLTRPRPTDLDGMGRPVGATGKPTATIGKARINEAGHQWYMAHFSADLDTSVALTSIQLYDALQAAWVTFTAGTLHRPQWAGGVEGVYYDDYQILVTGLE